MPRAKKKEVVVEVDVKDEREPIIDVEKGQSKDLIYGFQILSWVFLLGAIGAAITWIVFVGLWAASGDDSLENNYLVDAEICFQGSVASALLYFVFRHHYRHI